MPVGARHPQAKIKYGYRNREITAFKDSVFAHTEKKSQQLIENVLNRINIDSRVLQRFYCFFMVRL